IDPGPAGRDTSVPQIYLLSGYARSSPTVRSSSSSRRFRPEISLAASAGADGLLDVLLPSAVSGRAALDDLLAESARRKSGVIDRDEAARKRRCASELASRYCRLLLLDEERLLCRLAAELGRRSPEMCGRLTAQHRRFRSASDAANSELSHRPRRPSDSDSLLHRLLRARRSSGRSSRAHHEPGLQPLCRSELYCQLACLGRQLESAERDSDRFQPLTPAQLQPALAWWLDRAVYARDRRETEQLAMSRSELMKAYNHTASEMILYTFLIGFGYLIPGLLVTNSSLPAWPMEI
uniref:DUF3336 domain-containing protein n=1 Tax=Macrostomum lignano TaxID=282301 RepID=A0A1I8F6W8_9PLAT